MQAFSGKIKRTGQCYLPYICADIGSGSAPGACLIKREVRCKSGAIPVAVRFPCLFAGKIARSSMPLLGHRPNGKAGLVRAKPEDLPMRTFIIYAFGMKGMKCNGSVRALIFLFPFPRKQSQTN